MSKTCIDMDMFTAYFGQYISLEDRKYVESHMANCNDCLKLFALTAETLLDPEIYEYETICSTKAKDLWKSVKHKLDQFFRWSRNQFPPQWTLHANISYQTIPVMVRTEESAIELEENNKSITSQKAPIDFVHIEKDLDALKVEIYVEHTGENKITFKVRVQPSLKKPDDIFVYLERKDKGPTAKPFIKDYVLFENMPYDHYVIQLEHNNIHKGNFEFEINQNGIYWKNA